MLTTQYLDCIRDVGTSARRGPACSSPWAMQCCRCAWSAPVLTGVLALPSARRRKPAHYRALTGTVPGARRSSAVFLPHTPGVVNDIQAQVRSGFMQGHMAAPPGVPPMEH